jgi:PAS domain S-box-containing protein
MSKLENRRILVIDDNESIHDDFRKILAADHSKVAELEDDESALFGTTAPAAGKVSFELDSAHQGQEGVAKAQAACQAGRPYALAFVDIRMPPGWDGVETLKHLWAADPGIQAVVCTAYSDYSWEKIISAVGQSDRLLILKKPFDNIEVLQMASALTAKWCLEKQVRGRLNELDELLKGHTADLVAANKKLQLEISRHHTAADALRRAHEQNAQLLTSISSILISADIGGLIVQWNAAAEQHLGHPAADMLGQPLASSGIRWDQSVVDALARSRRELCPVRLDNVRFSRPDGKDGFLSMVLNPVASDSGQHAGVLVLAEEITERRVLEAQLVQAQKLESIGQLAAGIAHEINTPMQYVGDNTRFIQGAFADVLSLCGLHSRLLAAVKEGRIDSQLAAQIEQAVEAADFPYLAAEVPKAIEQSLDGVSRVTKIVRAMKEFSHPGKEEMVPLDLNHAIDSTATVARNEWKYVADLETRFDPELPLVPCLPGPFNQVILNMLVNAAHAIGDVVGDGSKGKGLIVVSTRQDGDWAEIRIQDSGTGIPEFARAKIFDPFFTTKEVGKGTGQGLAIARSVIVDKHGGKISFETEVGRGTTFVIRLPLVSPRFPNPA